MSKAVSAWSLSEHTAAFQHTLHGYSRYLNVLWCPVLRRSSSMSDTSKEMDDLS